MTTTTWVTLAVAVLALVTSLITAFLGGRHARQQLQLSSELQSRRDDALAVREAHEVMQRYRQPLARAAYDLQSRLFNILEQNFLGTYCADGSDTHANYAVENTIFLFAQYFGWQEIIRKRVQFLVTEDDAQTQEAFAAQDLIHSILQTDGSKHLGGSANQEQRDWFRIWAGDQRAIGEMMVTHDGEQDSCHGYLAFLEQVAARGQEWFDPLRSDLRLAAAHPAVARPRLAAMQRTLIDLLDALDPEKRLFDERRRTKVTFETH